MHLWLFIKLCRLYITTCSALDVQSGPWKTKRRPLWVKTRTTVFFLLVAQTDSDISFNSVDAVTPQTCLYCYTNLWSIQHLCHGVWFVHLRVVGVCIVAAVCVCSLLAHCLMAAIAVAARRNHLRPIWRQNSGWHGNRSETKRINTTTVC